MHDTLRFWLDRGVDGFRMDVVHCIGKDPALPDDPPELAALSHVPLNDRPETHELLRGIRGVLDEYPGDRMAVGEVYLLDTAGSRPTTATTTSCTSLQLPAAVRAVGRGDVASARSTIVERELDPVDALADVGAVEPRHHAPPHPLRRPRPGPAPPPCCCSPCGARRSSTPARSSAWRTRSIPAGPGRRPRRPRRLPGADPVGRRRPTTAGRPPTRGCPGRPTPTHRNVASEQADPASILHLYRRLLAARRASPRPARRRPRAARRLPDGVLGYERVADDGDRRVVLINFTDVGRGRPRRRAGTIEVATDGADEGQPFAGTLGRRPGRRPPPLSPTASSSQVRSRQRRSGRGRSGEGLAGAGLEHAGRRGRRRPARPRRRRDGGSARRPARPASRWTDGRPASLRSSASMSPRVAEQRGVDLEVAAELADPGRHQRHGRAQLAVELARLVLLGRAPSGRARPSLTAAMHGFGLVAPQVAVVEAADLAEVVGRRRRALGDADEREVGQHVAHRLVDLGRPALAPRGDRLGDPAGRAAQLAGLLDPPPRLVGVARAAVADAGVLALGLGPLEPAARLAGRPRAGRRRRAGARRRRPRR